MAPQENIPKSAEILGILQSPTKIAGFLVAGIIPQIWSNWRSKDTDGFDAIFPLLWAIAAVPFGVYNIAQNFNIGVQIQPQIFCALSYICWAQCKYYNDKWSKLKTNLALLVICLLSAGIEAGLIVGLRPVYRRGNETPLTVIGIIAAILLAVGLLPILWGQWGRQGRAKNLNFLFLSVDFLGAVFSLMSLVAQRHFDILGGILYIVCMIIEIFIFAYHGLWLYRSRAVRAAAKRVGMTYDEFIALRDDAKKSSNTSSASSAAPTPTPTNGRIDNLEK
ncbi:PQ loop repeat protein [Phyllosticta capitalensis]